MNKDRNFATRSDLGPGWAAVLVGAIAAVCVGAPVVGVMMKLLAGPVASESAAAGANAGAAGGAVMGAGVEGVSGGVSWPTLGWSVVYAVVIGALAALLAVPAAWAMRGRGNRTVGVLAWVPMLMPSYLAYAALTVLRSPGWWLGDVLATCDPAWSMAAGRVMAVVGLVMWSWPIALLAVAPSVARVDASALEMLRLDASWAGRVRTKWALTWRGLAGGVLAVGVVMIGSAVPLHLAQVPTAATRVWLLMTLTTDPRRIWSAAWPLLVIAILTAVVITRLVARVAERAETGTAETGGDEKSSRVVAWLALIIAAGSILVPMALMASAVKRWSSITGFWDDSGEAVLSSVMVAAAVGGVCAVLCGAAWLACSSGGKTRRAMIALGGVMLAMGLVPGVLVGQAIAAVYGGADELWVGMIGVVIAHVARFGCVGVMAGVYAAGLEPRDRRAMRAIDGAMGVRGWARAVLMDTSRGGWRVVVGVGLVCACLSMHEIEATVMVLPPGGRALAQQLLDQLHYLRDEHLGAAVVNVMGGATIVAAIAAWLINSKWQRAK